MKREVFIKDRNDALRSLDKATILAYYRKYGEAKIAKEAEAAANDTVFWASVHRARLTLASVFTEAERAVSAAWLREHGFEERGL